MSEAVAENANERADIPHLGGRSWAVVNGDALDVLASIKNIAEASDHLYVSGGWDVNNHASYQTLHSAARKVIAVAVAYAAVRLGLDAEETAAVLAAALAVLQAWSVRDDRDIARAVAEAVRQQTATANNGEQPQHHDDPRSGSRVGPPPTPVPPSEQETRS